MFAGMGTQWHGMGRDLMTLEPFRQSILKSDAVLQQHGLHLVDMIMHGDENTFSQTLNSFVGIAAIQVRCCWATACDVRLCWARKMFLCTNRLEKNILSFQVALVDVLKSMRIEPDGIVGHSVGELGCAYADGGLTAEETVLAAYWRGRCVLDADLPIGGMAAVGE